MTFKPHQAVAVSFDWDGVSDKNYAIWCQDFATSSGYEYTSTSKPQLGDGALLARFSDGTATNNEWRTFVVSAGPTQASISAGCSATNLSPCAIETTAEPAGWHDDNYTAGASWGTAQEYRYDSTSATWSCGDLSVGSPNTPCSFQ